jgi:hypothetical protein
MGELWQNPYVNIFKHYGVGQWKKCGKEGDVASLMDRVVKVSTMDDTYDAELNHTYTLSSDHSVFTKDLQYLLKDTLTRFLGFSQDLKSRRSWVQIL